MYLILLNRLVYTLWTIHRCISESLRNKEMNTVLGFTGNYF